MNEIELKEKLYQLYNSLTLHQQSLFFSIWGDISLLNTMDDIQTSIWLCENTINETSTKDKRDDKIRRILK